MGKFHLDHFKQKYGWTGKNYRALMKVIIAHNTDHVAKAVGRLTNENYKKAVRKISTTEKRFIVPDVQEVLPKRSVFFRKAATRGVLLTDSLRTKLEKDLREAMEVVTPKTGEARFIQRRGARAGRISPKIIQAFEKNIQTTFENYTKRDPVIGVPTNIHHIAVTEMRSVADDIKFKYASTFSRRNPDIVVKKRWIHNSYLSKAAKWIREGHLEINGHTVGLGEKFHVANDQTGDINLMSHPHDPNSPPEQVIGCHCDMDYYMVKKKHVGEVYKAFLLVEKGKKLPLGSITKRADGTYWKKMRQTGEPALDWVKLKNVKFNEAGQPVGGEVEGQSTAELKHLDQLINQMDNVSKEYFSTPSSKTYLKKMKQVMKDVSGNFGLSGTKRASLAQIIKAQRDGFFNNLGVEPYYKDEVDRQIESWAGSSSSNRALVLQYAIMQMLGEKELVGKGRFRFRSAAELQAAKNYYQQMTYTGDQEGLKKYQKAILAQFAFSQATLKRLGFGNKVKLVRGVQEQGPELWSALTNKPTAWMNLRPLSSWTTTKMISTAFGTYQVESAHPLENVFAAFVTHPHVMHQHGEAEFIMYGHGLEIKRKQMSDTYNHNPGIPVGGPPPAQAPAASHAPAPGVRAKKAPVVMPPPAIPTGLNTPADVNADTNLTIMPGALEGGYKTGYFPGTSVPVKVVNISEYGPQDATGKTVIIPEGQEKHSEDYSQKSDVEGASDDNLALIHNMPWKDFHDEVTNENIGGTTGAKEVKVAAHVFTGDTADEGSATSAIRKMAGGDKKKDLRIKEEYLANKLYEVALKNAKGSMYGKHVKTALFTDPGGGGSIMYSVKYHPDVFVPLDKVIKEAGAINATGIQKERWKRAKENLQQNFALDAIMGNWDVIGMENDNVLVHMDTADVKRIDAGGALRYRAQGAPKGNEKFGNVVNEFDSMRTPSVNKQAADIFGDLTNQQIAKQVLEMSQSGTFQIMLHTIRMHHGRDATLYNKMKKRMQFAMKWANSVAGTGPPELPEVGMQGTQWK